MRLGRRTGIDVRRSPVGPGDAEPWALGLLASPMRLPLDLLLGRPIPDAVAVAGLDAVLRAGLVDREAVAAMVAARSDNGIVAARRAVELADPRAEAVPESRLRVILVLDGLEPVPQYWIEDRTGRLVCVDLAFPERRCSAPSEQPSPDSTSEPERSFRAPWTTFWLRSAVGVRGRACSRPVLRPSGGGSGPPGA